MKVKVTEYTIRSDPIRWQIPTSIKVILEHFSLAIIAFEIFTCQISWPWMQVNVTMYNLLSGILRWQIPDYLSDENSNVCIFQPILIKIATWKFDLANLGQGNLVHHSQLCRSIANINLHKSNTEHFCASSYRLREINILNFWPWKFRLRSHARKTGRTSFDSECQPA